ncbi:hypothetical protein CPB83DRAFT_471693 [Crepidotus variabilis]|uniref:Uncharacterized protein n=1 Tax=Crepidotus variabilis TaxID=179855 RepID=A0A9P6ERL1_9AGAR|nr:hypothetical protein CPB83DRAFT_471693 [Crepidotus variabilis]
MYTNMKMITRSCSTLPLTVSITTPPVDIETSNNATSSLEARRFPQDQFTISVASIVPGQNEDTPSAQGRETEGLPESERQSQSDDEIEVTSQQFGQGTGVAECSEDNSEPSSPSSTIEPAPVPAESGSATPVLQTPFTFSTKLDDEDLETGVALSTIHDEDIGIESLSDNGGFVGQTSTVHQLSSPPRVLDNLSDGDLGRLNSPVTQVQSSDRISEVDDQVKGKGTRSRASTTNSCASFPDSRETTFSFDILETVLDQLRDGGIRRPLRSTVAVLISANGEKYENAASEDINHYIEWALAEELISGGGEGDKAWITLRRDMNNDVPE